MAEKKKKKVDATKNMEVNDEDKEIFRCRSDTTISIGVPSASTVDFISKIDNIFFFLKTT